VQRRADTQRDHGGTGRRGDQLAPGGGAGHQRPPPVAGEVDTVDRLVGKVVQGH
jgi:hypothetical protein